METQFFLSTRTGALLRRDDSGDSAWFDDQWQPTETVLKYMTGQDDDVEDLTEEQARTSFPDAFAD
jgi:hypothetical protein